MGGALLLTLAGKLNSILFLGGITIATSVVVLVGIGDQETFELLQILRFTFYGLAYRNPEAAAKRNHHPGRMPHSLRASNGMAKRAK